MPVAKIVAYDAELSIFHHLLLMIFIEAVEKDYLELAWRLLGFRVDHAGLIPDLVLDLEYGDESRLQVTCLELSPPLFLALAYVVLLDSHIVFERF